MQKTSIIVKYGNIFTDNINEYMKTFISFISFCLLGKELLLKIIIQIKWHHFYYFCSFLSLTSACMDSFELGIYFKYPYTLIVRCHYFLPTSGEQILLLKLSYGLLNIVSFYVFCIDIFGMYQ